MAEQSLDEQKKILLSMGKCASNNGQGLLCTLTANHVGRNHQLQVLGGVDDGKLLAEWPW